jgi:hypothetical protein
MPLWLTSAQALSGLQKFERTNGDVSRDDKAFMEEIIVVFKTPKV